MIAPTRETREMRITSDCATRIPEPCRGLAFDWRGQTYSAGYKDLVPQPRYVFRFSQSGRLADVQALDQIARLWGKDAGGISNPNGPSGAIDRHEADTAFDDEGMVARGKDVPEAHPSDGVE